MPRLYDYVGPASIKDRVAGRLAGTRIHSASDLLDWILRAERDEELVVATFVIDRTGDLLLADRRSEHVACAGGGVVMSAGEIFFCCDHATPTIVDVNNQSTGFIVPNPSPGRQSRRLWIELAWRTLAGFHDQSFFDDASNVANEVSSKMPGTFAASAVLTCRLLGTFDLCQINLPSPAGRGELDRTVQIVDLTLRVRISSRGA